MSLFSKNTAIKLLVAIFAFIIFFTGCGARSNTELTTQTPAGDAALEAVTTAAAPETTAATTEYASVEEIEDTTLNAEFADIMQMGADDNSPPVAQVAGLSVTQSEYKYMLNAYKGAMLLNSGFEAGADEEVLFWERVASNGRTRLDEAREKVFLELHLLKVCKIMAESAGISLDNDDIANIGTDMLAQIDRFGSRAEFEKVLSNEYGIGFVDYWRISELVKLRDKLYAAERDSIEISEGEMLEYYVQNGDVYGDMVKLRLILFITGGAELKIERTDDETKKLADETLAALKSGADMRQLILEKSEDPYLATNGGEYVVTKADPFLPEEVLDWAFAAPDGEYAAIETSFGIYVAHLEGRINRSFEEMKSKIEYELKETRLSELISSWLADPDYAMQIDREILDSIT